MDIQSILREAGPIANIINVVVIGVGYYFLIKLWREWLRQSREERVAGGRPMVVVSTDYSHLPEVNLIVRNFTKAPQKRSPSTSQHLSRIQAASFSPTCRSSRKGCPS